MGRPEIVDQLCSTEDGVFLVDSDQHIIRWNAGAERILGFAESEVLDRHCYEVIAGKTRPGKPHCQPGCRVHECLLNGTLMGNFDLLTRHKAGAGVWLNMSILSIDGEGPVAAHVVRDVTREKQTGVAVEQFLAVLGGSGRERRGDKRKAGSHRSHNSELPKPLSDREIEVLTLVAEGLPTNAVAERLQISNYTARNHIQNILSKLELHSKSQAVSYAFRKGLL
jgi:PAS domain S-box-containing protein